MKIETNEAHDIVLTEVYSGVLLRTDDGNEIGICMRDDTFEINVMPAGVHTQNWWRVNMQTGVIEKPSGAGVNEALTHTAIERGEDHGN